MRVSRQHVSAKSTVNEAQHLDNPVVLHPKRSDMPDVRSQDAIRNAVGVGLRSGGRGPWGGSGAADSRHGSTEGNDCIRPQLSPPTSRCGDGPRWIVPSTNLGV